MAERNIQTPPPMEMDYKVPHVPEVKPQRSVKFFFWLSLLTGLMSLFIFWLARAVFGATLVIFVPVAWIVLGLGIICLSIGIVCGICFLFTGWKQKITYLIEGLTIFCTFGLSIHFLIKTIIVIFFSATQAAVIVVALAAYATPEGKMILLAWNELNQQLRQEMLNSTKPEWRTIHIDYIGSDRPDAPGKASFMLKNMGPLTLTSIEGEFHAWTLFHVQKKVSMKFSVPLKPNESARLDIPLDGFGCEVKDIIEGKNKDVPTTIGHTLNNLEQTVDDDTERICKSSGPYQPNLKAKPEIDYHLRFKVQKMTTDDGKEYFAWFGNLEIANKNAFFEMIRDFTSPEWKLIKVDYVDEENTDSSAPAVFKFTNTGKMTISSIKGKFHVMDIVKDHIEKTVELKADKPLAPGESMTFTLPAGPESDLARKIISQGRKYDSNVGNDGQTSYFMRFQLQDIYTSDGRKGWIWFGELKGDIKPVEK